MKHRLTFLAVLISGLPAIWSVAGEEPDARTPSVSLLVKQTDNLRPEVLRLALKAFEKAESNGLVGRRRLTVIDYELPSFEKRLWVLDLETGVVLHEEWVAHGMGEPRGSGGDMERAKGFSNEVGSRKSSLGLFVTSETYQGKHGYTLRLDGLEPDINDAARKRLIVLHSADYVSADRAEDRLIGRSWGCPVVRKGVARKLIDAIKGGSVLWVYYPDHEWLKGSPLLKARSSEALEP
jgi:hypothetical protein